MFNQILPHVRKLPDGIVDKNPLVITTTDDFAKLTDKNWSSIMVNELLCEEKRELILNDYPRVQFIHICNKSLISIDSLTIYNLSQLRILEFEDDSLIKATSLILSSIF